MQKWEYAYLVFNENQFLFYEAGREPRSLLQLKKPSILNMSTKTGPDFYQAVVRVINTIAQEGWELTLVGHGVLIWYFKRPAIN